MGILTLKKKPQITVYEQQYKWKLTSDMNDTIEKRFPFNIGDISGISLLVTMRNGTQETLEV